jgi:hypothetical protein
MYFHYGVTRHDAFILHFTNKRPVYFTLFYSYQLQTGVAFADNDENVCGEYARFEVAEHHGLQKKVVNNPLLYFRSFIWCINLTLFFVAFNIFSCNVCIEVVQCIIGEHTNPHEYFDLKTLDSHG